MNDNILSVSELNFQVKSCLEQNIGSILLMGEISNLVIAASGHWYFSLKDERAQVSCAMFRGNNSRTNLSPKNGQKVVVKASVSLYEPRGDYQLIISQIQLHGVGLLQQRYEKLKQQLQEEGLFDVLHKKPKPAAIKTIGIITSSTGAAFHDICTVLNRRDPSLNIILYPSLVQGNLAAQNIVQQIKLANKRKECDVLIIGRGGGSLEDLWCFNEEIVARAIFESAIFTISAVGHEIDFTISDFVADIRAPTPSAAAEIISQDRQIQIQQLVQIKNRLNIAIDYFFIKNREKQRYLLQKLERLHPKLKLISQQSKLNQLKNRLINALTTKNQKAKDQWFKVKMTLNQNTLIQKIELHQNRIIQLKPKMALLAERQINQEKVKTERAKQNLKYLIKQQWFTIGKTQTKLQHSLLNHLPLPKLKLIQQKQTILSTKIITLIQQFINQKKYSLQIQAGQLHSISPLATLARGYSVTQDEQHKVILSSKQINVNEVIVTQLNHGSIKSKVIEVIESDFK